MEMPEKLYRWDMIRYEGGIIEVVCTSWRVKRETPAYWIIEYWVGGERRVAKKGKRVYARPTKKEALESFIRRKTIQLRQLRREAEEVEIALAKAGKILAEEWGQNGRS